jgi:ABC-type multidrug transport system fused ATPase/permease subunit
MKNKSDIIESIMLIILFCLFGMFSIWTWKNPINIGTTIDYDAFGTFGDFFGGVIGTLFAIAGVVFVFFTYINQLDYQKKYQIESRFFELLKLHEKNVEELKNIDNDIFNLYIKNIKNFIFIIKKFNKEESKNWDNEVVVKLGYLYFFYGASEYTSERLDGQLIDKTEVDELNDYMKMSGIVYNGAYADFGKYFRQLFQIVTYINKKTELNYKEKMQYIKSLRVRLNIEEQYLLFLNSIISNGLDWEKGKGNLNEQLITKYNLLKNIPKEYPQIEGIDFKTIYPNIHYEFNGNTKTTERLKLENLYK